MAGFISGFDVTVSQAEINEEAGGTISTSTLSDTHQGTPQRPSPKAALAFMDVKEIIGASYGEVGFSMCKGLRVLLLIIIFIYYVPSA